MEVVIVESPAKVKTINKYLGKGYEVYASFGHIRDLPSKDGSVDPDDDFAMIWDVDTKSAQRMSVIAKAVKASDGVILATDPDREGEAISWHVLEVLKTKKVLKDVKVSRVTFNALTKTAVTEAMAKPRQIDAALVDAYLARRALDYLVGFTLSPVLWRKLPGARSAGRVQSVTLRIICEREAEIERFVRQEYWSLLAALKTADGSAFTARLVGADGEKLGRLDIKTEADARALQAALEKGAYRVTKVEAKPARRNPYPPFTTSTMQQEASRKLGLSPNRTMQLAQRLYEGVDIGGETVALITYMRTDGVDMAPEAIHGARRVIGQEFGERYVPKAPRTYTVKAKNSQEAHEAVRPTEMARLPRQVARAMDADLAKLYELIWTRTVASQMESADFERTTVDILAEAGGRRLDLRANGQVIKFDGFLRLYQEGRDDSEAGDDDESSRLPKMSEGDRLAKERVEADQHFTEPPPRFTEATIIKRMTELGIGRPSTYDPTIQTLKAREYVRLDKKRLVPEDKGRLVTAFLESFFSRYVGYDFTADLEEKLDRISNHEIDWKEVLRDFWADFSAAVGGTKELRTTEVLDNLNEVLGPHLFPQREDGGDPRQCQVCGNGRLSLKLGKFGSFIGCSNYPECKYTRQIGQADGVEAEAGGPKVLGIDPASELEVTLRDGRFGPYIQLGEPAEGEKPKRSSLPKDLAAADVTLEQALALLSLPREVAIHPETKQPILAALGRYGPYVQHAKTYANLGKDDDVLTIGGNRAIDLIVAKESGLTGRRFGGGEQAGKVLGDHPSGGAIALKAGRYGPYVNHGKTNATLPKDADPTTFSLEDAVALLAAKTSGEGASGGSVQGRLLGQHPQGGPITVRQGRFGPYVNHAKTNATLKRDMSPESLTLEEAIRLIEDKAGEGTPKKKAPVRKAATKAAAKTAVPDAATTASGKKTPAKKTPAKKTAPAKKPAPKAAAAQARKA